METITYTHLRKTLSTVMDNIEQHHVAYHITRKDHEDMVLLSEGNYNALQETLYLLSNPANAAYLHESIAQAKAGDLIELDWDNAGQMD